MKNKMSWPVAEGLWSLFWRAVVLTPFFVLLAAAWICALVALLALPFWEIVFVGNREWLFAVLTPVVWIVLYRFTCWERFRVDRRDSLNGQDNV